MNDERFWEIVKNVDWANNPDTANAKAKILKTTSYEDLQKLSDKYRSKIGELIIAHREKFGEDYCNDSWSDCLAHIVGLGEAEHRACVEDPQKILDRLESLDYEESFSYAIPFPDDVAYLSRIYYERAYWPQVEEINKNLADGEYKSKDSELVKEFMELVANVFENYDRNIQVSAATVIKKRYTEFGKVVGYGLPNLVTDFLIYRI